MACAHTPEVICYVMCTITSNAFERLAMALTLKKNKLINKYMKQKIYIYIYISEILFLFLQNSTERSHLPYIRITDLSQKSKCGVSHSDG